MNLEVELCGGLVGALGTDPVPILVMDIVDVAHQVMPLDEGLVAGLAGVGDTLLAGRHAVATLLVLGDILHRLVALAAYARLNIGKDQPDRG